MLISGLIITVAKEIWDSKNPPHQFSWKDMRYGIAGWVIALLMVGSYVH